MARELNPSFNAGLQATIPPLDQPIPMTIVPPSAEGGATIPGPEQPRFMQRTNQPPPRPIGNIRFVKIIKSMTYGKPGENMPFLIGDRVVKVGDVIRVMDISDPRTGQMVAQTIMPVHPYLMTDRAIKMCNEGIAEPHSGPATVELGASRGDPYKLTKQIGDQVIEAEQMIRQSKAETATAAPQRRSGAM